MSDYFDIYALIIALMACRFAMPHMLIMLPCRDDQQRHTYIDAANIRYCRSMLIIFVSLIIDCHVGRYDAP